MSIEIISSGLQTTIQDLGRTGWRHMGIPESGGADKFSLKLANFLLDKAFNSPVLECTLTGPSLKFSTSYSLAITGADMNPKINNKKVEMNKVIDVKPNDILTMDNCLKGCRTYIALSEDILAEDFLGSVSTYLPGKLGGFDGKALSDGSIIETKPGPSRVASPLPVISPLVLTGFPSSVVRKRPAWLNISKGKPSGSIFWWHFQQAFSRVTRMR